MFSKITLCYQLTILVIANPILSAHARSVRNNFYLTGKILGRDSGMMYLGYYVNELQKPIQDSALISNGSFSFKGSVNGPTVAFISLYRNAGLDKNATNIFLEPSVMDVSLEFNNFKNARLTGSNTQKQYEDLRATHDAILQQYKIQWDHYTNEHFTGNKDSLELLLRPMYDSLKQTDYIFFSSHPQSYLTAYLLQYRSRELSLDSLTMFFSRLGYDLQQNIVTKTISERIQQKKSGSPGSIAKTFTAKDVNGNYLISQFFRGKYLLLDFWASWCVPCRKDNSQLINLYNKYKEKGLTMIGIADDRDTSAWKKAIQTDGIGAWNHILRSSNLQARTKGINDEDDISNKFDVSVLPTLILINPDGIIVGRYDDISQLDKTLAALFK